MTPYLKQPFPILLNESEEKVFLESLGFLYSQEEGLCLLSSEAVWLLKEKSHYKKHYKEARKKDLQFKQNLLNKSTLKENLFSYLGKNLAGRVFKFNDSHLSEKELPIFSDLFVFEPSLRKKADFEKNNSHIQFFKTDLEPFQKKTNTNLESINLESTKDKAVLESFQKNLKTRPKTSFYLQQENLNRVQSHLEVLGISARNIFCLSDRLMNFILPQKANFQWQASFFSADLGNYESSLPEHFLIIKQLLFPWCYDNLMSVFQKKGILEVWMRLLIDKDSSEFVEKAKKNLESFFPGASFHLTNHDSLKSFYVYEEDFVNSATPPFSYLQSSKDFFQGNLMEDLKKERELAQD